MSDPAKPWLNAPVVDAEAKPWLAAPVIKGAVPRGRPKQTLAPEGGHRGSVLPYRIDPEGNVVWDFANEGLPGAIWQALTLPGDVVTGKVSPAELGAVPGVQGDPDTMMRTFGLAGLASPVNPAVRAGDLAIPGTKTSLSRATPTTDDLMQAGTKGMQKARDTGVEFSPDAVRNLSLNIERALNGRGLPAELAPTTHSLLRKIQEPPAGSVVTGNNIIALRQAFQNVADANAKAANKDYAAAVSAIRALDEFIRGPGREGVVSGPAGAFAQTYNTARRNVAAAKRAEELGKKQAVAEYRAAAANSGRNLGNTLRQRLTDLLANPDKIRGWSAEEVAALRQIVEGTGSMNAWRTLSNRLGGGGGAVSTLLSGAGAGAGAAVGGWPGAVAGASLPVMAGTGSRAVYNKMVSNAVDRLEQLLLQRSPQYEQAAGTIADNPRALMNSLRALLLLPKQPEQPTQQPKGLNPVRR